MTTLHRHTAFSLLECLIALFIVALLALSTQAIFSSSYLRWQSRRDRDTLRQLIQHARLVALTGTRLTLVFKTPNTLQLFRADQLMEQVRLRRKDCVCAWHGMHPALNFQTHWINNNLAGRLEYRCQHAVGAFTDCLNRFGRIQSCSGTNTAH